ncbi:hypothetical protein MLD38_021530 [Melastoma candidum]|uniref:Uncharacterized protein n=1 Tax=Melastoma candidum TaxID=119954 RepID=A0ACB9QHB1_9MYRT|nr:hypothetical protein MLD38_021530 [Melastoma candidum]
MVLIEQEPEGLPDERRSQPPPPSVSHSAVNEDSDGFETASDGEVDNDAREDARDATGDGGVNDRGVPGEGEGAVAEGQSTSRQDGSGGVAMDEEANKKALDRADEAKLEGNQLFRDGQYEEALSKYELALQTAPDSPAAVEIRSACHSNRAVCFLKLHEETIKECSKALELNPSYLKALIRRSEAHEKLDHFEEAIADCKKILELDPVNVQARKSIIRLEPLAEEKREKMKEEMIAKLKDMGNSLLGRFGMSVANFKAVKDPNTGSYSISFQR